MNRLNVSNSNEITNDNNYNYMS